MSDLMQWRRRRTARWMSLSLAARGAVEGVVAATDEHGELQLPPEGLPALAHLLGRPWTEVEPAIAEVLRVGKLVYDRDRNVIVDPTRARATAAADAGDVAALRSQLAELRAELAATPRRSPAMAAAIAGVAAPRPLSMTSNAIRKREQYARKRSSARGVAVDPRQLELPTANPAIAAAMAAPPLSDLYSSSKKKKREGIPLDGREPPTGWADSARTRRPDLSADHVAKLWSKFAREKNLRFFDWPVVQSRWEDWLDRERAPRPHATAGGAPVASPPPTPPDGRADASPPDVGGAPYYREAKLAAPDVEPESPPSKPRAVVRLVHDEAVRNAAASLAAGLFALPPPQPRSMSA